MVQFLDEVRQGKGGQGFFLDPWWLEGPGHEVVTNKRLWDLGAELVDNIPHSVEVRRRRARLWSIAHSVMAKNIHRCIPDHGIPLDRGSMKFLNLAPGLLEKKKRNADGLPSPSEV